MQSEPPKKTSVKIPSAVTSTLMNDTTICLPNTGSISMTCAYLKDRYSMDEEEPHKNGHFQFIKPTLGVDLFNATNDSTGGDSYDIVTTLMMSRYLVLKPTDFVPFHRNNVKEKIITLCQGHGINVILYFEDVSVCQVHNLIRGQSVIVPPRCWHAIECLSQEVGAEPFPVRIFIIGSSFDNDVVWDQGLPTLMDKYPYMS